jgi:hypothetical protein
MNSSTVLEYGKELCVEKALLKIVAGVGGDQDFQLYFDYFKKFKLSHAKVNLLGVESHNSGEFKARRIFYHAKKDERPPAFFDASNWSVSNYSFLKLQHKLKFFCVNLRILSNF